MARLTHAQAKKLELSIHQKLWLFLRNHHEYRNYIDRLVTKGLMADKGSIRVVRAKSKRTREKLNQETEKLWGILEPVDYRVVDLDRPIFLRTPVAENGNVFTVPVTLHIDFSYSTDVIKLEVGKLLARMKKSLPKNRYQEHGLDRLKFTSLVYERVTFLGETRREAFNAVKIKGYNIAFDSSDLSKRLREYEAALVTGKYQWIQFSLQNAQGNKKVQEKKKRATPAHPDFMSDLKKL